MDRTFQIVTAAGVIALGLLALAFKEVTLAATSLGILGGILNAPKAQPVFPPQVAAQEPLSGNSTAP